MNKSSKITADVVAFDYGNTLVLDPFEAVLESILPAITDLINGLDIPFAESISSIEVKNAWVTANKQINYPYCSHFHQEEPIVQAALKILNVPDNIRATAAPLLLSRYRQALKYLVANASQTKETLTITFAGLRAKGKKLAILSNDRSFGPGSTFHWLGVDHLVDLIATSEELGVEKPSAEIFQMLAEKMHTTVDKIVYIGDDPIRDIEGGHNAGCQTILIKPKNITKFHESWRDYSVKPKYEPDAVITDLIQLLNFID